MSDALRARAHLYAKYTHALLTRAGVPARLMQGVRGPRYLSFGYRLSDSLKLSNALNLADKLALATAAPNVAPYVLDGLIWYDFELRRNHWQSYTRADVSGLTIGLGAAKLPITYPLTDGGYHGLFAGGTKAGKSTAIQSLLCGIATTYMPDDLDLYIIDPHGDYSPFARLPHLAAPIATGHAAITDTITTIRNLYTIRKANNNRRAKRLIIIIDETQYADCIGTKNGRFNKDTLAAVADLARGAGKYRIHLILGSQRPSQKDLPGIIDNIHNRYIGRVDNIQTANALSGHAQTPAHKLSGYGDFLAINSDSFTRFQVARPTQEDLIILPRAETVPTLSNVQPLDDRFPDPDPPAPGRPETELQPNPLAWAIANPNIGRRLMAQQLAISQRQARRHKTFANDLITALCRLGFAIQQGDC